MTGLEKGGRSHDLGVIARMCDRIAVMYLGRIVELAEANALYHSPKHPYTQALLNSVPVPDPLRKKKIQGLLGDVPSTVNIPSGCRFRTRCPVVIPGICEKEDPALLAVDATGSLVACVHYDPVVVQRHENRRKPVWGNLDV